jgi:hypothetical protein
MRVHRSHGEVGHERIVRQCRREGRLTSVISVIHELTRDDRVRETRVHHRRNVEKFDLWTITGDRWRGVADGLCVCMFALTQPQSK